MKFCMISHMILKVPDSHRRDRLGAAGREKASLEGEGIIVLTVRDFRFWGDMCFRFNLGLPLFNKICKFSFQTPPPPKKKTNVAGHVSIYVALN